MSKFIEVHSYGVPHFINLNWVEEIVKSDDGVHTTIYLAYDAPGATCQDYINTDESYEEVRRLIRAVGG